MSDAIYPCAVVWKVVVQEWYVVIQNQDNQPLWPFAGQDIVHSPSGVYVAAIAFIRADPLNWGGELLESLAEPSSLMERFGIELRKVEIFTPVLREQSSGHPSVAKSRLLSFTRLAIFFPTS